MATIFLHNNHYLSFHFISRCSPSFIIYVSRLLKCLSGKEPTCQCRRHRRHRFDPWSQRSPGGGKGNPLQHSYLEILWTEEPEKLWSMGLQRVDMTDRADTHTHTHTHTHIYLPTPERTKNIVNIREVEVIFF